MSVIYAGWEKRERETKQVKKRTAISVEWKKKTVKKGTGKKVNERRDQQKWGFEVTSLLVYFRCTFFDFWVHHIIITSPSLYYVHLLHTGLSFYYPSSSFRSHQPLVTEPQTIIHFFLVRDPKKETDHEWSRDTSCTQVAQVKEREMRTWFLRTNHRPLSPELVECVKTWKKGERRLKNDLFDTTNNKRVWWDEWESGCRRVCCTGVTSKAVVQCT